MDIIDIMTGDHLSVSLCEFWNDTYNEILSQYRGIHPVIWLLDFCHVAAALSQTDSVLHSGLFGMRTAVVECGPLLSPMAADVVV